MSENNQEFSLSEGSLLPREKVLVSNPAPSTNSFRNKHFWGFHGINLDLGRLLSKDGIERTFLFSKALNIALKSIS